MVAGAIVGLLIVLLGIYVWYYYITTFVEEGNHLLFALSLFQIGIGTYILFRASRSNNQGFKTDDIGMPINEDTEVKRADPTPTPQNPTTLLTNNSS